MEPDQPKIKILGQEIPYPNSWTAVAGILIVAGLVGFIVWVYFVCAEHEHLTAFSNLVLHKFSSKGVTEEKANYRIIQFWTPSEKTRRDLEKSNVTPEALKWQTVTEEKVNEFGVKLSKMSKVIGHRRYEVAGHGRATFKHGWWWVVTVKDDFKLEDFAKFYISYWGNPDEVYLEEYRTHEQYVR